MNLIRFTTNVDRALERAARSLELAAEIHEKLARLARNQEQLWRST